MTQSSFLRILPSFTRHSRAMASQTPNPIYFGSYEVTPQVFHKTPNSFAVVNLKPLLPGHVLVSPLRVVPRLTDLSPAEVSDLFRTVQAVQKMLASVYFTPSTSSSSSSNAASTSTSKSNAEMFPVSGASEDSTQPADGSFNIAIQDGVDAGQTVPHVHCHVIPRVRGDGGGDTIYEKMAGEEGNVGGALWDRERPRGGGHFPRIEDADRLSRSAEDMNKEAEDYRKRMKVLGLTGT